jgi:GTP-binding protein
VELHTVADIGLVGLPNAGKSTLLSRLTAARPKIADYPFTTLSPNLGVAGHDEGRMVVADIPGLIEGASRGRGLGHRFLRHIVRCRALVLMVDLSAADPVADLATLRAELRAYAADLLERPSVVVGTKSDLVEDASSAAGRLAPNAMAVSAVTGQGIGALVDRLGILAEEGAAAAPPREPFVVLRPGRPRFTVERERGGWRVRGQRVERWVLDADLDDERSVATLQKRLAREGVDRRLRELGARPGDEVAIGDRSFEFVPDPDADAGAGAGGTRPGADDAAR